MDFPSLLLATGLVFPGLMFQSPAAAQTASEPNITPELRGDIMMARKMYREAIDFYKPGSDNSAVLANKTGIAYQQLLDYGNARKYYEKAVKEDPKYAVAINNLGTVYYAQKSYRRAVEQYRRALRLAPTTASFLSNLGTVYFARRNYKDAMVVYQQALALDPEIFESHGTVGTTLQDRTVEETAKLHYFVAKTYAKAGSNDRALQYIRKALEEGFKEREKFVKDPEFAALQEDPEFIKLMATEQKVL